MCSYNCWGCKYCYGDYSPKPKPILTKDAAKKRLEEAVKQARRAGLSVECAITEKVTTVKVTNL